MNEIDPNILIPAILALIGGWFWKERRAASQQSLRQSIKDRLDAVITATVHRIANDPELRARARTIIRAEAVDLLAGAGVIEPGKPLPAWASMLLDVAIDEGLAELAELLTRQRAEMVRATTALAAGAQSAAEAFDGPTNPVVPPIDRDIVVFEEIRQPPVNALEVYGEDPDELEDPAPAAAAKVRAAIKKGD